MKAYERRGNVLPVHRFFLSRKPIKVLGNTSQEQKKGLRRRGYSARALYNRSISTKIPINPPETLKKPDLYDTIYFITDIAEGEERLMNGTGKKSLVFYEKSRGIPGLTGARCVVGSREGQDARSSLKFMDGYTQKKIGNTAEQL